MKKVQKVLLFMLLMIGVSCAIMGKDVSAAGYDTTAPTIEKIEFAESVVKPGVLDISITLTEEETGASNIYLAFYSSGATSSDIHAGNGMYDKDFDWNVNPRFTGTHIVKASIPSTIAANLHYLAAVTIYDKAGNQREYYYSPYDLHWRERRELEEVIVPMEMGDNGNLLLVKNEFDVNFQTYITNTNITAKLKDMPEGQCGMILFDQKNHTMKKEWFDEIKGKDKTIVMSNDGIQWIYNGKDIIHDTKDISCYVNTNAIVSGIYNTNEEVLEFIFHSNGTLPGKAKVRIKADYIFNIYNISNKLYLYYKDTDKLNFEDNPEYFKDGDAHWCEFDVTHNSTFVMSGNKIDNLDLSEKNNDNPSTPNIPNNPSTPNIPSNPSTPAKGKLVKISGVSYTITKAGSTGAMVEYKVPKSKNVTSVTIPATVKINGVTCKVTSIAKNAFKGCSKLKKVVIGKNVKTIGANAFNSCRKLTTITFKSGSALTTISDKAFYKCTALTKIMIPSKVSKIGKQAFYGCKKLKSITIKTTKLTTKNVGKQAWKGIYSKATIKVPSKKWKAYKKLLKSKGVSSKTKIKK